MTIMRTAEFDKYADHFVDLSPERSKSLEEIARFAAQYLSKDEKLALVDFLDQCLDGTHAEDELHVLWANSGSRVGVQPASRFLAWLRNDLAAGRL